MIGIINSPIPMNRYIYLNIFDKVNFIFSLQMFPAHIQSVYDSIVTSIKTPSIILDDDITWDTHNVVRILWQGYGIFCDITETEISLALPGINKDFPHEEYHHAIHMIKNGINDQIEYCETYNDGEFELSYEEISEGG